VKIEQIGGDKNTIEQCSVAHIVWCLVDINGIVQSSCELVQSYQTAECWLNILKAVILHFRQTFELYNLTWESQICY
jgi:hypothetical protein